MDQSKSRTVLLERYDWWISYNYIPCEELGGTRRISIVYLVLRPPSRILALFEFRNKDRSSIIDMSNMLRMMPSLEKVYAETKVQIDALGYSPEHSFFSLDSTMLVRQLLQDLGRTSDRSRIQENQLNQLESQAIKTLGMNYCLIYCPQIY